MICQAFSNLPEFSRFVEVPRNDNPDVLERISQAELDGFRRGLHEGTERAEKKTAASLAEAEADFAARFARGKDEWVKEIGDRLFHFTETHIQKMTLEIACQLEEILSPFVKEKLRSEAIKSFEAALMRSVKNGTRISLSGPESLVTPIVNVMTANGFDATSVCADDAGLSADIDKTRIRAEFDRWFADLEARGA